MAEISEMRDYVKKSYSNPSKRNMNWEHKVSKMPDGQVTAIYIRLQTEKRKNQPSWDNGYPVYIG